MTVIPIIIGALKTIPKMIDKGTGRLENKRTSKDHPENGILNIG